MLLCYYCLTDVFRVGSHVVFAWIHCTDVRIHCTDILIECRYRFFFVFSSIPRKLYTIFQTTFSPIKRYQDSIFKLLTLSTNSVPNSGPIFAAKNFVTESVFKVRSFMRISWHR